MIHVLIFLTIWCGLARAADVFPPLLSQAGLYSNGTAKAVAPENLPYEPQYPLWSDGGKKARWIYLPEKTRIVTGKPGVSTPAFQGNMNYWIFPVGTKFWKEFSFARPSGSGFHRVETRMAVKVADGSWQFASYLWDESEEDARLVSPEGRKDVYPIGQSAMHDIPSRTDCVSCHNRGGDMVLGFEALQLSSDRDPLALHAQPLIAGMVTLGTLIETQRLTNVPPELREHPPTIKSRTPQGRAAMGYLHANCGGCHNPNGTATHSWLFFRYPWDTADESSSPVFVSAINRMSDLIRIPGQEVTLHIKPGDPANSALIYAMKSSKDHHMPPIGSKIADRAAISLLEEWIRGL